jgi:hypothetical protein
MSDEKILTKLATNRSGGRKNRQLHLALTLNDFPRTSLLLRIRSLLQSLENHRIL